MAIVSALMFGVGLSSFQTADCCRGSWCMGVCVCMSVGHGVVVQG